LISELSVVALVKPGQPIEEHYSFVTAESILTLFLRSRAQEEVFTRIGCGGVSQHQETTSEYGAPLLKQKVELGGKGFSGTTRDYRPPPARG